MADNTSYSTHTTERTRSSGTLAFIVGGLVIAVGVIAYVIFGGDTAPSSTGADASSPSIEITTSSDSAAGADAADDGAAASAGAQSSESDAAATAGASTDQ